MEYRRLGSLNVSLVGIGCNNFGWRTDEAGTAAVVDAALDADINFFDMADSYAAGQSEEFLGKAIQGRRSKAIIATKFGMKMGEGKEGAGKYRKGAPLPESSRGRDGFGPKVFNDANLERADALAAFAKARGHSLLELAFSWLAARPEVSSVIAGAKTPEQVRANSIAASWKLTPGDLAEKDRILRVDQFRQRHRNSGSGSV